jgi:hypothetical protein
MKIKKIVWIWVIVIAALVAIHFLAVREKTGRLRRLSKNSSVESYSPSGPIEGSTVPTQATGQVYVVPGKEER